MKADRIPRPTQSCRGTIILDIIWIALCMSAFFYALHCICGWVFDSRVIYEKNFSSERLQLIDSDHQPRQLKVIDE